MKIGVLALQGAVHEHIRLLENTNTQAVAVKKKEQIHDIDGLIIPGGESTTIGRLIRQCDFQDILLEKGKAGFPMWGTCAGLIILAQHIIDHEHAHLGLMNMHAQRNAFGRQKESFETDLAITGVADDFRAVFIRAPLIHSVGEDVDVLSTYQSRIVAARQQHLLATSFHPELTEDDRFHRYFVEMVSEYKGRAALYSP